MRFRASGLEEGAYAISPSDSGDHFFPKARHVHLRAHPDVWRLVALVPHVAYRLASRQRARSLHVYAKQLRVEKIRLKHVEHRTGVVQGRIIELKHVPVRIGEELKELVDEATKARAGAHQGGPHLWGD